MKAEQFRYQKMMERIGKNSVKYGGYYGNIR